MPMELFHIYTTKSSLKSMSFRLERITLIHFDFVLFIELHKNTILWTPTKGCLFISLKISWKMCGFIHLETLVEMLSLIFRFHLEEKLPSYVLYFNIKFNEIIDEITIL